MEPSTSSALRERILEGYRQLEGERSLPLSIELRLKALSRVTGIERKQLDPIARPMLRELASHRNRNRWLLGIMVFLSFGLLLLNIYWGEHERQRENIAQQLYLTRTLQRIDGNTLPGELLESIRLGEGRFYLYQTLLLLPNNADHTASLRIYDANGDERKECNYQFQSTTSQWNIWCPYMPDSTHDTPGRWHYESLLNGRLIGRREFSVGP